LNDGKDGGYRQTFPMVDSAKSRMRLLAGLGRRLDLVEGLDGVAGIHGGWASAM
jgi:hypothetical protein